jgi:lysophospholipase L1-like esterase
MSSMIMFKRVMMTLAAGVVMLTCVAFMLVVGEIAIRSVHLLRDGIPFFESPTDGKIGPITLDQELGWRATEYYGEALVERTERGRPYPVRRSQKQYGFRRFGNLDSNKPKILVIGDSFTHATVVSDDRTYYALLAKLLNAEVFAYGASGYGTLQEFLIFERYINTIRPDVILWQYCSNDFINNDNQLERLSLINNNGLIRPYWEGGKAKMLSPKESSMQIREWINRRSRFLYFVVSRIDRLGAVGNRQTIETEIELQGIEHPGFLRAMAITDELMGKVRLKAGTKRILAFNCQRREPYDEAFKKISTNHDITYMDDVALVVVEAKQRGEDVYAADGAHWNEKGHELAARTIAEHFRR